MPRGEIQFREGVSRLRGASLEAPYDLQDAEIGRVGAVASVSAPVTPTDPPPQPASGNRVFQVGSEWLEAEAETQRGAITYLSRPGGLEARTRGVVGDDSRIPQILSAETRVGNVAMDAAYSSTARHIQYTLVPINDRGEAGPWCHVGAYVAANLPEIVVETNEHTRTVEVYRTAAYIDGADGRPDRAALVPRFAGEFGAQTGGQGGNSVARYWAMNRDPDNQSIGEGNYYFETTSTVYASSSYYNFIEGDGEAWTPASFATVVGWEIEFERLTDDNNKYITSGSSGGLTVGQRYRVRGVVSIHGHTHGLVLENLDGSDLSFEAYAVLKPEAAASFLFHDEGVPFLLFPPSGGEVQQGTFLIVDDRQWAMDLDPDGEQPNLPDGEPLYDRRPFNTYAPTSIGDTVPATGYHGTEQTGIEKPRFRDLLWQGGRMYGAAPRWPAKPPSVSYLSTGASGERVLLQSEYKTRSETIFGPTTLIANAEQIAIAWQGVDVATNIYVEASPYFDIVGINQFFDTLTISDPNNYYLGLDPSPSQITAIHGGTVTTYDVTGTTRVGSDTQFDLQRNLDDVQGALRFDETVSYDTEEGDGTYLSVGDISGRYLNFEGGFVLFDGSTYNITSVSNDGSSTTIQTDAPTGTFGSGSLSAAVLRQTWTIAGAIQNPDEIVVSDSGGALSVLTGGTFTVVNNPAAGTYTAQADSVHDAGAGETTLFVTTFDSTSVEGSVQAGEASWSLFRRIVPLEGAYLRNGSTLVWNVNEYDPTNVTAERFVASESDQVSEPDAVFYSHVNRPMEMTFQQFLAPKGSSVRALITARLAEEEGLRAYNFYVATAQALYVADHTEAGVRLDTVSSTFGVALSAGGAPMYEELPGFAAIVGTDGLLYPVTGRRGISPASSLVTRGAEPWTEIKDIVYHREEAYLWVLTESGVWCYDIERKAIVRQYNNTAYVQAVYDDTGDYVLATTGGTWDAYDGTGAATTPAVQTQPIMEGGREFQMSAIEVDYEKASYDPTLRSTWAQFTHAVNEAERADFTIPRSRPVYPLRPGRRHQMRVESFDLLRGITYHVVNISDD